MNIQGEKYFTELQKLGCLQLTLKPTATDVDSLCAFPFLDSTSLINRLKSELPSYLAVAEDVSIAWWKSHEADLQNWTKALRLVLLVQPLSAAAERVFSNSFSSFQESSLEDYIQ